MHSNALLEVVTVVRNARAALQETIDSIRRYKPSWMVYSVIDGASSDGTLDLIKASGDVIDRFVSEKDLGIFDAMNKAVNSACGDYLVFLGAGDALRSEVLLLKQLSEIGCYDLISCPVDFVGATRRVRYVPCIYSDSGFDPQRMYLPHPGLLVKRRVFEEVGGFDISYQFSSDLDWLNRVLVSKKYSCVIVGECLADVLVGGVSHSIRALKETREIAIHFGKKEWRANFVFSKGVVRQALGGIFG